MNSIEQLFSQVFNNNLISLNRLILKYILENNVNLSNKIIKFTFDKGYPDLINFLNLEPEIIFNLIKIEIKDIK